jgi:serine protease inhibitor
MKIKDFKKKTIEQMNQINPIKEFKGQSKIEKPQIQTNKFNLFFVNHRKMVITSSIIVALIAVSAYPITKLIIDNSNKLYETTVKTLDIDFTTNDIQNLKSQSFKYLNNVTYPSKDKKFVEVDDDFKNSYFSFVNTIYNKDSTHTDENYSFSPYGLYSNLNLLSFGASSDVYKSSFDNLLGMSDNSVRNANLRQMYKNNYYVNDNGTIQTYNGAFYNNSYTENSDVIDELTKNYCEAFELNFSNNDDVNKMITWANERAGSDLVKKDDLEINENSVLYLFSTFYFNNKWNNSFATDLTTKKDFNLMNGETASVDFMQHTYYGDTKENDKYISFYDYFQNGSKIKYVVPKSTENLNVFSVIGDEDIFSSDVTNYKNRIIQLSVPKFDLNYDINFTDTLKKVGLNDVLDPNQNSLGKFFEDSESSNFHLSFTKQFNRIAFSEDAALISSVTESGMSDTSSPQIDDNPISISLNQPFIYVIYDSNDLPIYVGNVSNPA